tara:strand:+ start:1459 stop:1590 length:132 start_codon:yes stop_codon:yes gene_type:complete
MTSKKFKKMEKDISRMKHSLELIRTIVPVSTLILQIIILIRLA